LSIYWALFVEVGFSTLLVVFGIGESYALARHQMTFSSWIRLKLGVHPSDPRRWWAPILFVLVLVGFNAWFIPHILNR